MSHQLYLDLLEKVVTNMIYCDAPIPTRWAPEEDFVPERRTNGTDWPSAAHTMVGLKRIRNVRACLDQVVTDGVAGDFIETGVWRGGVCIFARGFFKTHGITDRRVWVADSFQGFWDVDVTGHPLDKELASQHQLSEVNDVLGVSLDTVRDNFERYGLLDDQVRFLPGWFKDTLPVAPIGKLAVMRLDGDLYESTMDALTNLYDKLSPGGFVIIDDYVLPPCRKAVEDFRSERDIGDPLEAIDEWSVFWRLGA